MYSISSITFACDDPDRLASFWEAALGGDRGDLPPSVDSVLVERPGGSNLLFKDLPCRSREDLAVHLDLHVDDREAAEERLSDLGASVRERKSETVDGVTYRWTVLEDPAGNGFCISEH